MMGKRLALGLVLIISIGTTATGCWDRHEIDDVAFVMAIGADRTPPDPDYQFTQLIAVPRAIRGPAEGAGAPTGKPYYLVKTRGSAPSLTMGAIEDFTSRFLFINHNKAMVLGEPLARGGVEEMLERALRCWQCRPTMEILVARGRAEDVLNRADPRLEQFPSEAITGLLRKTEGPRLAFPVTLREFVMVLLTGGKDPVAPVLEAVSPYTPDGRRETQAGASLEELAITGLAVFRGERLQGFLEDSLARGAMWGFGRMRGRFAFSFPAGRPLTLMNVKSKSRLRPDLSGDRIIMNLEIEVGGILSDWYFLNRQVDPETLKSLERSAASTIAGEISDTLSLVQKQYRADIFGFGRAIERRDPSRWRSLKDRWYEIYPEIETRVKVKVTIREPGSRR